MYEFESKAIGYNQPIPIPKPPRLFNEDLIGIDDTTTTITPPPP